jgi:hypothetical protein
MLKPQQNGAMAAALLFAIAAHCEIGVLRKRRQQVEFVAAIGSAHLVAELARERRPGAVIVRMESLLHEFRGGERFGNHTS